MDLSALIFVALAVAWAAYLIPKALKAHEESVASRSVDGFSARIRVLARREPVDSRSTQLVRTGEERRSEAPSPRPVPLAVRREAAARAARRRLRVVLVILASGALVSIAVGLGRVAPVWLAVPGGVLVAWLVACRLMVKSERAAAVPVRRLPVVMPETREEADPETEEIVAVEVQLDITEPPARTDQPAPAPDPEPVAEVQAEEKSWDPVPVTLPTYVAKEPAARRSVRTIDLDSTGVWTSGRTDVDAAIAREADAERAATRGTQSKASQADDDKRRRTS